MSDVGGGSPTHSGGLDAPGLGRKIQEHFQLSAVASNPADAAACCRCR